MAKRTRSLIGAEHEVMSCHLNASASVILKVEKVEGYEFLNIEMRFTSMRLQIKPGKGFLHIWIQYNSSH